MRTCKTQQNRKPKTEADSKEEQREDPVRVFAKESDEEGDEQEGPQKSLHATIEPNDKEPDMEATKKQMSNHAVAENRRRKKIQKNFHQVLFCDVRRFL